MRYGSRGDLNRREVLAIGSMAAVAAESVAVPEPRVPLTLLSPSMGPGSDIGRLRGYLRVLRAHYADAVAAYRSTGDVKALKNVRHVAYHRIGFCLHFEPQTDAHRAVLPDADAFLGQMEDECPEVAWGGSYREGLKKFRAWAQAGGRESYEDAVTR